MAEKITKDALVELLKNAEPQMVQVTYQSEVSMTKTGNPFFHKEGRSFVQDSVVTKCVTSEYQFGTSYQDMMRMAEACSSEDGQTSFEAQSLPWGEWHTLNRILQNKGELYLRVYRADKPAETTYQIDGKPASEEQVTTIKSFLQKKSGTPAPVQPINLAFSKLRSITIDGQTYEL